MAMTITLKLKEAIMVPIEADSATPDNFAGNAEKDIKAIKVWHGNTEVALDRLFDVNVNGNADKPADVKIIFDGDMSRVKHIGEGMTDGEIVVNGDVDMHAGALMEGGKITVKGNADGWAGRNMKGGELIIEGNAGHYVGSGYRGEARGMRGGKITVNGDAGDYVGNQLAEGEICINGNAGLMPGLDMRGGKIIIDGSAALPGAGMLKGTVIVKGDNIEMMPTFGADGTETVDGVEMKKFVGDLAVRGRGKGTLYVK